MEKILLKQKPIKNKYSQNFFKSSTLISKLIATKSNISNNDTVIDIGAGSGVITKELLKIAKKVIAYEIDKSLADKLAIVAKENINLQVRAKDFLNADLNILGENLKVFSNIPFFLTAEIVRKLFIENINVKSAYLIMEKEAAWRFIGKPFKKNSVLSVLIGINYSVRITWNFNPTDFIPAPNANVVLVSFERRDNAIKDKSSQFLLNDFIAYIFNLRKSTIKNSLYNFWKYGRVKEILKNVGIGINEKVSEIEVERWPTLFDIFLKLPQEKKQIVFGEYVKLMRHQDKLNSEKVIVYND